MAHCQTQIGLCNTKNGVRGMVKQKSKGWGVDNSLLFMAGSLAEYAEDGGRTSVLHDDSNDSIVITLHGIRPDDERLPDSFKELIMGQVE